MTFFVTKFVYAVGFMIMADISQAKLEWQRIGKTGHGLEKEEDVDILRGLEEFFIGSEKSENRHSKRISKILPSMFLAGCTYKFVCPTNINYQDRFDINKCGTICD